MNITDSIYQKTRLTNGIRVVTEQIPYVRSVSVGAWIVVGSRDENTKNNGISHYIEHMMFKGTSNQTASEIAQSLESVGGHLNAFTGKELTCYYAHVLDEHLPRAVEVIADILSNSTFDEAEMVKEKRVVIEELNTINETPEELIHDLFWYDVFPNHALGLSIVGKRQTVSDLSRQGILDYLAENYTADRIVIAAAGNVQHDEILKLVERAFEKFSSGTLPNYQAPSPRGTGRNIIENGSIQAHICLGTQAYPYRDRRKFGLLILNTLLGSGMSSRLFQNIREKHGIAYSIYSYIDFMFDTGLFGVYVGTDGQNIDVALDLIHKELALLKTTSVSAEELERTKSQLKGNLMLSLEGTSSRMNRLAKMEIYLEDHYSFDDTLNEIERITVDELLGISSELFSEDRIFTTILKPPNAT